MLKHYIEFLYPGSFMSESSIVAVADRNAPVEPPKGAYGYRHFSREEMEGYDETLTGKPRDYSPMTFYGEVFTLGQVKALNDPNNHILISNMECNKWDRVVRTVRGNWQPLNDGDRVVLP